MEEKICPYINGPCIENKCKAWKLVNAVEEPVGGSVSFIYKCKIFDLEK